MEGLISTIEGIYGIKNLNQPSDYPFILTLFKKTRELTFPAISSPESTIIIMLFEHADG